LIDKAAQHNDQTLLAAALKHFAAAVQLQPRAADFRNDYAMALGAAGQNDDSLAQLEAGFQADLNHLGVSFNLTNAYAHRQRWAEALAVARHALSLAQAEGNTEMIDRINDQLRALNEILNSDSSPTPSQPDRPAVKSSRP
jgi:tetratricopeptide (TPR) repeat protein